MSTAEVSIKELGLIPSGTILCLGTPNIDIFVTKVINTENGYTEIQGNKTNSGKSLGFVKLIIPSDYRSNIILNIFGKPECTIPYELFPNIFKIFLPNFSLENNNQVLFFSTLLTLKNNYHITIVSDLDSKGYYVKSVEQHSAKCQLTLQLNEKIETLFVSSSNELGVFLCDGVKIKIFIN